jgi:hypothetical protein
MDGCCQPEPRRLDDRDQIAYLEVIANEALRTRF